MDEFSMNDIVKLEGKGQCFLGSYVCDCVSSSFGLSIFRYANDAYYGVRYRAVDSGNKRVIVYLEYEVKDIRFRLFRLMYGYAQNIGLIPS